MNTNTQPSTPPATSHHAALLPYLRYECRNQTHDQSYRTADSQAASRLGSTAPPPPVDVLLGAISRLFDAYVLGPDRSGRVASCLGIAAGPPTGTRTTPVRTTAGTPGFHTRVSGLVVDLASLPPERLRRLLDAFATKIHYDRRQRSVRVAVRISALLDPHATGASTRIVVPDGWPELTPTAAHALLRLLTHVAESRNNDQPRSAA